VPTQKDQFGDVFITLCHCGDVDHTMKVSTWVEKEDDIAELIFEFGVDQLPFWYRLKKMFQYLFGKDKRFDFRGIIMNKKEAENLMNFINEKFIMKLMLDKKED
jgi:hypothetical protein